MPDALGSLLAVIGTLAAGYGAWRLMKWYRAQQRQARQTVDTFLRILPALAEHEQFFKLLELRGPKSHYLERHGPMLRGLDLRTRATTGNLEVAGLYGDPVTSTRWLRHKDLLHAVESSLEYWRGGARPPNGVFKFEFAEVIGEGFTKDTCKPFTTKVAKVVIRKGEVVTAFPAEA